LRVVQDHSLESRTFTVLSQVQFKSQHQIISWNLSVSTTDEIQISEKKKRLFNICVSLKNTQILKVKLKL